MSIRDFQHRILFNPVENMTQKQITLPYNMIFWVKIEAKDPENFQRVLIEIQIALDFEPNADSVLREIDKLILLHQILDSFLQVRIT